jgi:hypothetical protein
MPGHFIFCSPAVAGKYCQALVYGPYFLVINLSGNPDEINLKFGHDLTKKVQEIFDQLPQENPAKLIPNIKDILPPGTEADLLIAKIEGNTLVISSDGLIKAKLLRDGKLINLLGQTGTISGLINSEDYLFLGTSSFFEEIFSPDTATNREAMSLKMEAVKESSEQIVALVIHVENLDHQDETIMETIPPSVKLSKFNFRLPTLKKDLFLRRPKDPISSETPPKRILYAALLILIFLVSLVAFQLRSRNLETKTKNLMAIEKKVEETLDSAKKLAGLNDNIARDTLLQGKKDFLNSVQEQFGPNWQKENSTEARRLKEVLAKLESELGLVSHTYTLSSLDSFTDFSLLRPNANITSATLVKNEIVVVDGNNGAVYSLGTKTKSASIVGGATDFKNNAQVDFASDTVYVWTPAGIISVNRSTNTSKILLKSSEKWGQVKGLKTFGGNIYLIDSEASQIWKYQGTDLGFLDLAPYLRSGSADLSKVVSFAIDGSIYVVSASGNMAKFSGGYPEDFTVSGLETPLSNPTSIFASDETKNVYILDSGNNRVVVLDKKGIYQAQYLLPRAPSPEPSHLILADESLKKVFLFSGSKVFSFDLR